MIRLRLAIPADGVLRSGLAAAGLGLLAVLLVPMLAQAQAHTRQACVDGVNCYCDCVEDTPGTGPNDSGFASTFCKNEKIPIDPNLIWCEDFEHPTYEHPTMQAPPRENTWQHLYGAGSSACIDGTMEGPTQTCRNILQSPRPACRRQVNGGNRPNSVTTLAGSTFSDYEYRAGDPDLDETGGHSTLNGEWDGCQSWYFPIRPGQSGGSGADTRGKSSVPFDNVATISQTMMVKYSSNHFIGNQSGLFGSNVKGDRYYVGKFNSEFSTLNGGRHGVKGIGDECTRGSSDPATGYPASDKFPFASLLKSHSGNGIDGRGECCSDDCFSSAVGPSGPRIGIEEHQDATKGVRLLMPPRNRWNPRVPGGVPMSVEGDKDGRDEWLCFQWTIQNHGTDQMNYYHWINNQLIMRFENLKGSDDRSPFTNGFVWANVGQSGVGVPKPTNTTSEDWVQARDNFHLTASPTPATCAQVGFDGLPTPEAPAPPASGPPNTPRQLQP